VTSHETQSIFSQIARPFGSVPGCLHRFSLLQFPINYILSGIRKLDFLRDLSESRVRNMMRLSSSVGGLDLLLVFHVLPRSREAQVSGGLNCSLIHISLGFPTPLFGSSFCTHGHPDTQETEL